ncbi:MAG: hypothetical protein LBH00_06380 [Planctomycetaceae bacterium]|nr:hypothetical protein [Planctomycetaceae bacterium]
MSDHKHSCRYGQGQNLLVQNGGFQVYFSPNTFPLHQQLSGNPSLQQILQGY